MKKIKQPKSVKVVVKSCPSLKSLSVKPDKTCDAFVAGGVSGVQLGLEIAMQAIEAQMKNLNMKRGMK